MGRHLAAALVVLADTLLLTATHDVPTALGYAPVAALLAFATRAPLGVFAATLALAVVSGGSYPLLVWVAHRTGLATVSRRDTVVVAGAVAAWPAVAIALGTAPRQAVVAAVVFVVLPLLVGRYLAQHRRLVAALESHNRQLRRERELLAERGRLRERLRIARDMHDSLGRRLSLVSVRAAALEVTTPPERRADVEALGTATRAAVAELYELIGSLRGTADDTPGLAAAEPLVAEFRAAGVPVTVETRGDRRALAPATDAAAYRVVEEGLTNAAKHAPGSPVTVRLDWEADALVLSLTNPVSGPAAPGAGFGLLGLRERVEPAGGFLDHRADDGTFRLVAMLPTSVDLEPEPAVGRVRATALGVATGALLFLLLPASLLTGVA
ncbi:sensor histidine kinase [Actinophytocola gossypii]|uniref:histidine kinase n=1 Tax=Actinophytocola gossypii TaxID=2812003 RepID=A0ABT2J709_9PSEU|nr:histidine kinase [Actinophytocola gossypii]MCT2583641.1 histidine kinase [Actinophytocola gossypii]